MNVELTPDDLREIDAAAAGCCCSRPLRPRLAWRASGTAAPVGWWTWLSKVLPDDAEAGGGVMVAVIQLAIALGATLGGVVYAASGHRSTFAVAAAALCASALVAGTGRRGGA